MKKILFVNERLGGGGAERVMVLLANKLSLIGYDVTIALFCEPEEPYYQLNKKINLVYLKNPKRHDLFFTNNRLESVRLSLQEKFSIVDELFTLFFIDEKKTKPLKKHIASCNYDVVISFLVEPNIAAIRASKNLGCKIIISERNVPVSYKVSSALQKIRNRAYKHCDICVFQTREIMNWFCDDIKSKGVVISNPIKEDLPEPFVGERRKIVTNFCGFKAQKNLPLLITAFSKFYITHKDYKLIIYGSGGKNNNIFAELINRLNMTDNIEIRPFSYDIHQEILDYKMFVSSSDFEGISNSMLEAMAIGLPTICTDCDGGGARETIVDHVNGILVPKGNSDALASAMCEVADNDGLAIKLSLNSIEIRKNLAINNIVKKWISIFD